MRRIFLTSSVIFASSAALAEVPRVAVDIAPVHSIVAAVMDGVGTPDLIVPPGTSPHDHNLRPSEARALDEADVVVWMGHALTPWLEGPVDTLGEGALHIELLDLPQTIRLESREGAAFAAHDHDHGHDDHDDHGDKDHAHDDDGHDEHAHDKDGHDDHGHDEHAHEDHETAEHEDHAHDAHDDHAHADGMDPHAWLDPQNAVIWAGEIAKQLAEIDPANAQTYTDNAQAFEQEISDLNAEAKLMLEPVSDRPFIVFHDAYQYFEARFGIAAVGAVSASDAEDPSPRRVAELREEVQQHDAVCALTEPQFNPGIMNAMGDLKLGEIDPIGVTAEPGPDLYASVIRAMATSLAECFK
ncbi:zinc ABC transporter substrate-binding protein [uncultured Tateyamaria sp.]|uniref:zinc ABC transporter substrate-binding protein n=1 Tax=uncultured Tateyamaria sp. TaxID=455651 RepID=UPI0026247DF2|nr:zinc ABC transporter substrate-binding protein [uncultured Tateyamaria sp.]